MALILKYIKEISDSEIDFDLYDDLGISAGGFTQTFKEDKEGKHWTGEGYPMKIQKVIKKLED